MCTTECAAENMSAICHACRCSAATQNELVRNVVHAMPADASVHHVMADNPMLMQPYVEVANQFATWAFRSRQERMQLDQMQAMVEARCVCQGLLVPLLLQIVMYVFMYC
jgi:hypothetical protein